MLLEICASSLTSAIHAQSGGAQRIELCCNLEQGGLTPSAATIQLARKALTIDIFVLIRPRIGDFVYSMNEFEQMKADIFTKPLGKTKFNTTLQLLKDHSPPTEASAPLDPISKCRQNNVGSNDLRGSLEEHDLTHT